MQEKAFRDRPTTAPILTATMAPISGRPAGVRGADSLQSQWVPWTNPGGKNSQRTPLPPNSFSSLPIRFDSKRKGRTFVFSLTGAAGDGESLVEIFPTALQERQSLPPIDKISAGVTYLSTLVQPYF